MDSPFDTKLTIGAAIAAVAFTVLAIAHLQRASPPDDAAAAPAARTWDGPVGPGLANARPGELPSLGARLDAPGEPGLAVDAGGHLVADLALRKLIDSWLTRGPVSGRHARAGELRAFLKRTLAAPAAGEADRFVTAYLDYLEKEEGLLVHERFRVQVATGLSERDVEHLLAWREQRAQQRQRLLGEVLAQAWFGSEDARCGAILRDWQLQHVALAPGQELDQAELRERRIRGAALEARRDADAQDCAARMTGGGT